MKHVIYAILALLIVGTLTLLLVGCAPQEVVVAQDAGPGQDTGPPAEQQATWTMILALTAPLLVAVFKQTGLTKRQNSWIALGITMAIGIGDALYFGQVDPKDIATTTFTVLMGAFASYKTIWQAIGFDDVLTNATSVIKKPDEKVRTQW